MTDNKKGFFVAKLSPYRAKSINFQCSYDRPANSPDHLITFNFTVNKNFPNILSYLIVLPNISNNT
ncbi:hypothetical protein BpHYR1_045159 [Brachionus plicatilis]|uniref:Uncharacterized protein n=1 Tax=Brachionus plicatilis TaxID=10195 RepID=A0A3M7SJ90_BRAPC|nr:hypothetical protein BpHYR1_045159 [Brachionus plicatilis]